MSAHRLAKRPCDRHGRAGEDRDGGHIAWISRRTALDLGLILLAAAMTPLLFAALRRLGLPFGLRIVAMHEDYNWLLILQSPSAVTQAQTFWTFNDRNPLSPWWYIAAGPLFTDGANGPYLTRLLMGPLLGASLYAAVRAAAMRRARGLALGAGMLGAAWVLHTTTDQIAWNFIGALALSLLSVSAYAAWIAGGRARAGWYGLSLALWYAAFGTYGFQVGAVVGIAALALLHPPAGREAPVRRTVSAAAETLPYALLLGAFVLGWKTTQNPSLAEYYTLEPRLLLRNLPESLFAGVWPPPRYAKYAAAAWEALEWRTGGIALLFGAGAAAIHTLALRRDAPVTARDAAVVLAIAAGLALPTLLIESMSGTWTVGTRWPMVDQGWLPLLWLGGAALLLSALPWPAARRFGLSAATGACAAWLMVHCLGYNHVQSRSAAAEAALRREMAAIGNAVPPGTPANFVVLVDQGVPSVTVDVMSYRVAPIWWPGRDFGLRMLRRDGPPTEFDSAPWARVVLNEGTGENLRIGAGVAPLSAVRILRFDGRRVIAPTIVTEEDVRGYPVDWRRAAPLRQEPAPT